MKRPFEVLIILTMIAMGVSLWRPSAESPAGEDQRRSQVELENVDLKDPQIGYHLTFNRLKPGMTVKEAEQLFGPPDYRRPKANYQQWEKPLTQVYYSKDGILTEVGGSGRGALYLGDRMVFHCGLPESDIIKTFGEPLSVIDMEYNYEGMTLFCGSAQGDMRWVSAIVLGKHIKD